MSVIKNFDVLKNITPGFRTCLIVTPMHPLPFQRREETFRDRVIVTISRPTHATDDPLFPENTLDIGVRILTASIGVVNQTRSG